jgi:hypothetical protein
VEKGGSCTFSRPPEKITLLAKVPAAFSIHAYPVEKVSAVSCYIKGPMQNTQPELKECLPRRRLSELVLGLQEVEYISRTMC